MGGSAHRNRARKLYPALSSKELMPTHGAQFDFGSGMPLPPSKHFRIKEETPFDSSYASFNSNSCGSPPFRSMAQVADGPLLDYLRVRKISPYFLVEIDKFLNAHPDIPYFRPDFADQINHAHPLDAYMFFIKGYTKPARYIDGALPDPYNIPLLDNAIPLQYKIDPELTEFFGGHEYRYDILAKMEFVVNGIADALYHGQRVTLADRKLVILAWYGNLVDAYKHYEYNHQTEWLSHRYLPEHVILTQIPKRVDDAELNVRVISYADEDCQENMRTHKDTRFRMARAADQNVDVIEVLLEDFTAALARQGLKRDEIERMKKEAIRNIEHQRETSGGRDIVDMVMDRAKLTRPSDFGRVPPIKTSQRMHRINGLKHSLRRLLAQEAEAFYDEPSYVKHSITQSRRRVERDLVLDVTQLAAQGGSMRQKVMNEWRKMFTRAAQAKRETHGLPRIDVLTQLSPFL